jgi:capsular polysaccharide biosynthesis protein
MSVNKEDFNFSSTDLAGFIIAKRKPLLIVVLSSLVLSTVFSFFIEPKYQSSVIIFPAPAYSISNSYLSINTYKPSSSQFGEEEEAERLLQVLKSELFKAIIIKKYNLYEHYNLAPNQHSDLSDIFDKSFTFRRTKYMGIEIRVLDTDPNRAAEMANYSSDLLDSLMNNIFQERAKKAFKVVEAEYKETVRDIAKIKDTMAIIAKKGILDFENQSAAYTEAYVKAINSQNNKAERMIRKKMETLEEYGSAYLSYKTLLEEENQRLSLLNSKYSEAKVDANESIPYKYVVDKAYPSDEPDYPIKWMVVTLIVTSSFLMALIILIILNKIKRTNL